MSYLNYKILVSCSTIVWSNPYYLIAMLHIGLQIHMFVYLKPNTFDLPSPNFATQQVSLCPNIFRDF